MNRRSFLQALALLPAVVGMRSLSKPAELRAPEHTDWWASDPIRGLFVGQDITAMVYRDHLMRRLAATFGVSDKDKADLVIWENEYDKATNPLKEFGFFVNRDTGKKSRWFALQDLRFRHQFVEVHAVLVKELF